ncbi:histidine phosphatase family protein [Arthrobacter sp. NyZ413]|uniref:histidine phosphatase family protein n=1 Tax=Arthrobacter sp. NyZ413 TaxID=3144669 RepID=UPI002CC6A0CB|nr:histidine phosphatase family protein [Arthrobacter sp.]
MNENRKNVSQGAVELLLVRHGESLGNVAATTASMAAAEVVPVEARDADIDLSALGREQSVALGRALGAMLEGRAPDTIWCSPYARAHRTAALASRTAGWELPLHIDERLRDRELGILDTLTALGVESKFPEEARRRRWLGKFYYRPPGGESWADVVLRLRSFLLDLERSTPGGSILLVTHDAVILLLRYILEGLSEAQVLGIAGTSSIFNASVTRYVRAPGEEPWTLETFNSTGHLASQGVTVTEHGGNTDVHPR